jgi:hypothetical protein
MGTLDEARKSSIVAADRYLIEKEAKERERYEQQKTFVAGAIICLIACAVFVALVLLAADAFRFWWWG